MSSCMGIGASNNSNPGTNSGGGSNSAGENSGGGSSGGGNGGGSNGGGGGTSGPTDITALNHIVFMFQENRSFDHYFGHLNTYRKATLGSANTDTVDTLDALTTTPTNPADDSAPLNWSTTNATSVTVNNAVMTGNSMKAQPTTATLYTAVATSSTGLTAQASVVVGTTPDPAPPKILVGASPMNVEPGKTALLTWATTDGSSVTISPPPDLLHAQPYGPNASARITAPSTPGSVTYTLTSSSNLTTSITLTVGPTPAGAPTVTITHNNQGHVSVGSSINVSPFVLNDQCVEDFSPDWLESHGAYNRDNPASDTWLANGFVHITAGFSQYANSQNDHHHYFDVRGSRNMGYYDEAMLPLYYFLATQFGTSDNFFSPIPSNSGPNRAAELAATTAGHAHNPPTLNVKTIFELLDNKGISWKVYYSDASRSGTPLTTLTNFVWGQQHADAKHVAPVDCTQSTTPCAAGQTDYFTDLKSGNFPAVALIEPGFDSGRDEHPGNPVQVGAVYDKKLIQAFMESPIWKDSVFFLTYDEAGGFYDHVKPMAAVQPDGIAPVDLLPKDPAGDFTRTGFRMPLMVVSPYVKPHVVSHKPADATAILKFIEKRFNLPNLTKRDLAQPDFDPEFFDFTKPSQLTPPTLPVQPGDAPCAAYAKNP
ncbi:MAG TPA: alkaline phosphatase family protein [Terriglobales bacterium]|nr:alkaline phosphatase family protein [Terriglobales bacterium]